MQSNRYSLETAAAVEREEERPDCLGPAHVAIIMDGNGRWASERGLPRNDGHRQGARRLGPVLECAGELGISVVTLYAFSCDNWQRPEAEVSGLMSLFASSLRTEAAACRRRGVRLQVIGRRDRLPPAVLAAIRWAEWVTRRQRQLLLRIAIDYSSRWAIANASHATAAGEETTGPRFRRALARAVHSEPVCDPDLVLRTGGECRLSDFLLWEAAYAELFFRPVLWPDFGPEQLRSVVAEFRGRERRFGGVPRAARKAAERAPR